MSSMELYMDEKLKQLSRKEIGSGSIGRRGGRKSLLRSSSSTTAAASTARRRSFSRRCASLVKEQRARFYIMRRCVIMLICWRDYQDF